MKYLGLMLLFLCFSVPSGAEEWPVDFYYDLDKQALSINGDSETIENGKAMFVLYRNGISVLKEKDFDFKQLQDEPLVLKAKEGELLRVEIWGANGLEYFEDITAGKNTVKEVVKEAAKPQRAKSILISDDVVPEKSILVGDDMPEESVLEEADQEAFGYKDNGSRKAHEASYGYKKDHKKVEEYTPYGHKKLGYESQDPEYGRKDY